MQLSGAQLTCKEKFRVISQVTQVTHYYKDYANTLVTIYEDLWKNAIYTGI